MKKEVHRVSPQGWRGRLADTLMMPIMYLGAGTLQEAPQRTHFWNNSKLAPEAIQDFQSEWMVECEGDPEAMAISRVRFHLPLIGGWRNYVVLSPATSTTWHVGWKNATQGAGASRIRLQGSVRMLLGPEPTTFFGIDWQHAQVQLRKIGEGKIGDGGEFSQIPLL